MTYKINFVTNFENHMLNYILEISFILSKKNIILKFG